NIIETKDLILNVNKSNLCIEVTDKTKQKAQLTTICPTNLGQALKGLDINPGKMQNVYGLGQEFKTLGLADGDLISKGIRQGLNGLGNGFQSFQNAAVGNVQIPVYYAVGDNLNYALFMDNVYWQKWDFTKPTWEARMYGDQLRFYVMTGADLPDLRADFMELTGTPPVPSLKSFGLWVSEFGYDNWNQIDTLAQGLRKDNFPLDGFVLDLNWFGGIRPLEKTNMGRLDWDENQEDFLKSNLYSFANPDEKIKEYAQDGISLAAIEESYLAQTNPPLPTFKEMPENLMAYQQSNNKCDANNQKPIVINANDFWGTGNMFDWSDAQTGKWIHDNRRFPNLVNKGINTHWTDLGEPERFDGSACYEGVETNTLGKKNKHADIHNLYNLLWNKSIWEGYVDKQGETDQLGVTNPRPLILTRSGAAGIQRYGAAMWSGDIASNLESLATHANAQMQMSFSGIDYYGSDIGGFRREVMPGNDKSGSNTSYQEELFTQWFANGSWFDIPVRPHTDDEFNSNDQNPSCQSNFGNRQPPCYETAPDLIGKTKSNLANIRQRYELLPYYYSLGYRAFLKGEPIIPPPVFYYQNDSNLRQIGNEKMIGKDILVGMVANHGEYQRDMYLPAGKWVNYHSNEWFNSSGETLKNVPVYRNGILRLPTFVRSGAIIPQMFVDENTKDAFGNRKEGATPH
ncbi:MAG TPA: TIM-barrel domain-containing protein, partial [Candidatus Obscuribacterales bacterium]